MSDGIWSVNSCITGEANFLRICFGLWAKYIYAKLTSKINKNRSASIKTDCSPDSIVLLNLFRSASQKGNARIWFIPGSEFFLELGRSPFIQPTMFCLQSAIPAVSLCGLLETCDYPVYIAAVTTMNLRRQKPVFQKEG